MAELPDPPPRPRTARRHPAFCEWTMPGRETEAIDCWAWATKRHLDDQDFTTGVFCDEHSEPGGKVEDIDLSGYDLTQG